MKKEAEQWRKTNSENKMNKTSGGRLIRKQDMYNMKAVPSRRLVKAKRFRSAFTTDQINYLEQQYKKCPYIINIVRKQVAEDLNISERAIKIWFQNRRMREKKESYKEFNDESTAQLTVEFAKDQLNNGCTSSVNDQQKYSLPVITAVNTKCELGMNTNNYNKMLARHFVKNIRQDEHREGNTPIKRTVPQRAHVSPYFVKPTATSSGYETSAAFSIDLYKKYKNGASKILKPEVDLNSMKKQTHTMKQNFVQYPIITSSHKSDYDPNIVNRNMVEQNLPSYLNCPNLQNSSTGHNIKTLGIKNLQNHCVDRNIRRDQGKSLAQYNYFGMGNEFHSFKTTKIEQCSENNLVEQKKKIQPDSFKQKKGITVVLPGVQNNVAEHDKEFEEVHTSNRQLTGLVKNDGATNIVKLNAQAEGHKEVNNNDQCKSTKSSVQPNNVDRNRKLETPQMITDNKAVNNVNNHTEYNNIRTCVNIQKLSEQVQPQDLSSGKPANRRIFKNNGIQHTRSIHNNPVYIPMYSTVPSFYAQPYMPASGVVWKPANLMPVVPSGTSAAHSHSQVGNIPVVQNIPKSCNCDCHGKHSEPVIQLQAPGPQYIFTAVPYQNTSA